MTKRKQSATLNTAPTPPAQVSMVLYDLDTIGKTYDENRRGPVPTLESASILYNAYADVPAYGVPHIDSFATVKEAKVGLARLLARLVEMFPEHLSDKDKQRIQQCLDRVGWKQ